MRLTIRTNLAARVLMCCAVKRRSHLRSADIAAACNASGNHLAQVINQLQIHGFVVTQRGRTGGLQLARAPQDISIGAGFPPVRIRRAVCRMLRPETNTCPLISACRLHGFISRAVEAFYPSLTRSPWRTLSADNCGLTRILSLMPDRAAMRCDRKVA